MKYKYGSRRKPSEYEPALAQDWKRQGIFQRSVTERPVDDSYVFYDGPPFITGNPHHGTLLSSIVKDAVPRFWTMRGRRVERKWGWDCHGLPAENFVEKQLGITDRREIGTKWSLAEYITKARESMVANSETWESTIDRVGRWVDFRGAYRTMDKDFMESVWWAFKTLYEKGKIYEGRKVLMYDTKFATPVSKAEVTMDNDAYREVTDPSAYVKFEVVGNILPIATVSGRDSYLSSQDSSLSPRSDCGLPETVDNREVAPRNDQTGRVYLLAWTTTPWTLPANMALAVNPEFEYGVFEVDNERMVMAVELAPKVLGEKYTEPITVMRGSELVGVKYQPVVEMPEELMEKTGEGKDTWTVVAGEFVSVESGTGVVHVAPAYGEDDYALLKKYEINFADVLDENGYYLPAMQTKLEGIGVRATDERGVQVWNGNKFVAKCLEASGKIWKIEYIKHEYPFNPRSKERIMYRAFPSWFFEVEDSKVELLAGNQEINWFPEYLKEGRFAKNIEQAPDWNLSRDRFWATAMPVWKGDRGSVRVVGSYDELYELSGARLEDYHRPWVDEITFEIDGEKFARVDKVLDCWFESGAMPFAQMHYPFENKEKFEKNYPADFIVEYVGQVRAWFYYVHVLNMALFGRPAYKNVITTGTLAGNDGRKMSKSLGNYTDPNELMDRYSADALRLLLLSSPVLAGEDFTLLDKDVSDTARKLAGIWNVYDFFTMYAEVDRIEIGELNSSGDNSQFLTNLLDRWIVARVWQLRNEITEGMEEYNLPKALAGILPFVDDLSNWFVRRSRRRFWKSEDDNDKMNAYRTLHYVLVYLAQILAPFVPFLAEELYLKMTGGEQADSVHLLSWPEAGEIDEVVLAEMMRTREIITEGLALRMRKDENENQVKVRQPLAKLVYEAKEERDKLPEFYERIIAEEVNVKQVEGGEALMLDKKMTPELLEEGFVRELIRVVQAGRKKAGLNVDDRIRLMVGVKVPERLKQDLMDEVLAVELVETGNYAYDEIVKVNGENVMISLEKAS